MLFQAVMKFLSRLVEIKKLVKGGKVHSFTKLTGLINFLFNFRVELLQMAVNLHHNSPLGANKVESTKQTSEESRGSEALDSTSDTVKLDKSNILMLGPTGSG